MGGGWEIEKKGSLLLDERLSIDLAGLEEGRKYALEKCPEGADPEECRSISPAEIDDSSAWDYLGPLFLADCGKFGNASDFAVSRLFQLWLPAYGDKYGERFGKWFEGRSRLKLGPLPGPKWLGQFGAHLLFMGGGVEIGWGISKQAQSSLLDVENFGYPATLSGWSLYHLGASEDNFYLGGALSLSAYAATQTFVQHNAVAALKPNLETRPFWFAEAHPATSRILYGNGFHDVWKIPVSRGSVFLKLATVNMGTYLGWSMKDLSMALLNDEIWEQYNGDVIDRLFTILWHYGPLGDMGPTLAMFTNAGHVGGNLGEYAYEYLTEGRGSLHLSDLKLRVKDGVRFVAGNQAPATEELALRLRGLGGQIDEMGLGEFGSRLRTGLETFQAGERTAKLGELGRTGDALKMSASKATATHPGRLTTAGQGTYRWWNRMEDGVRVVRGVERELASVSANAAELAESASSPKAAIDAAKNLGRASARAVKILRHSTEHPFIKHRPESETGNKFADRMRVRADALEVKSAALKDMLTKRTPSDAAVPAKAVPAKAVPSGSAETTAETVAGRLWRAAVRLSGKIKGFEWGRLGFNVAGNVGLIYVTNYFLSDLLYEEFIPQVYKFYPIENELYEIALPNISGAEPDGRLADAAPAKEGVVEVLSFPRRRESSPF